MIPDDPERGVPWSSSAEEKDKESSVIPRQECHKRKQTMNSSMKIRVYKAGVVQSLASNSSPSSTRVLCESFPRLSEENQRTLSTMKFIHLALVLFCAVAYAAAQAELEDPRESHIPARFRRQTEPKGSVSIQATKPMSGPDRRPSVDVDYHQRIFEKNGANANAYGGLNIRPGQPPQPHIGIQAERNYNNGFIRGYGQVQRGPGGRPSPTIGVSGGFRFRRDVDFELGDQELH